MNQAIINMFAEVGTSYATRTIKQLAEKGMGYLLDGLTLAEMVEDAPLCAMALMMHTNSDTLAANLFDELDEQLPELPAWYFDLDGKPVYGGTWQECDEMRDVVGGGEPYLRLTEGGTTYEMHL